MAARKIRTLLTITHAGMVVTATLKYGTHLNWHVLVEKPLEIWHCDWTTHTRTTDLSGTTNASGQLSTTVSFSGEIYTTFTGDTEYHQSAAYVDVTM